MSLLYRKKNNKINLGYSIKLQCSEAIPANFSHGTISTYLQCTKLSV